VAAESALVKHIVNGNLHNKARKDARAAVKLAEAEKAKGGPHDMGTDP